MQPLTISIENRRMSGVIYLKLAEMLFIALLLCFMYPFYFAISGIDPTIPLEVQSEIKIFDYMQMALPFLCLAIAYMHRGSCLSISLIIPIVLYPLICITSTIWSVNPYYTFKYSLLLLIYIFAIAAICHILDIEVICKIIVKILIFLILASVVMAVVLPKYGTHPLGDSIESIHAGLWRGVFSHKNILGASASTGLFVFLFFPRLMDVSFGFRLICIVAAIACLSFSQSAGSWLSFCVMVLYYFMIKTIRVSGILLVLVLFGMCVLAFLAYFYLISDLLAVVGRDATFTGRTGIWAVVLDAIWQEPILGSGYFAATNDLIRPLLTSLVGPAAVDPHNGYLDVMLGTGIVGLVILLVCILVGIIGGITEAKSSAVAERESFILLTSFPISSLFFAFFEVMGFGVQNTLGALTFLSLTAIPLYSRRHRYPLGVNRFAKMPDRQRAPIPSSEDSLNSGDVERKWRRRPGSDSRGDF
jgi:O-antigen ligase